MTVIQTKSLCRKYNGRLAVEELDLQVGKGEVLGFLGPNGAGKTTTIRMISGIIAPTSGEFTIEKWHSGQPVEQLHQLIGLLTESPGFYEKLSAYRNLEYFAGFYGNINPTVQIEKYLKLMGLWERREDAVGSFSKGMKQRLALARAILHEPPVLFLDEPTSGLDPEASGEVRELIKKLRGEGRTIFLSTHNLTEAEQLCDRIAIFRRRLLALDTPANLRQQMFQRRINIRLDRVTREITDKIKSLNFVKGLEQDGDILSIELSNTEKELPEVVQTVVQSGGRIQEVKEESHSLEEIYLTMVKEEAKG